MNVFCCMWQYLNTRACSSVWHNTLALYDVLLNFRRSKGFRMMRLLCYFKKATVQHWAQRQQAHRQTDTPSSLRHGFNLMTTENSVIHFIPFKGCFVKSINRCHCHCHQRNMKVDPVNTNVSLVQSTSWVTNERWKEHSNP
jgi:hypothetical protein